MPQFKNLMPIRTKGTAPPLFCVHGEPLQIAFRIRHDRPLYGVSLLYHPNLGYLGKDLPVTIEDYARTYLEDVRKVQPNGPYYLCGYSAGGMIAFEMARQLLEQGETIGDLTLVEPTVYSDFTEVDDSGKVSSAWKYVKAESDKLDAGKFIVKRMLRSAGRILNKRAVEFTTSVYLKANWSLPQKLRWAALIRDLRPAMRRYAYDPFSCNATIIYCSMTSPYYDWWTAFWQEKLMQKSNVVSLPDAWTHRQLMEDPGLSQTVEIIDSSVASAASATGSSEADTAA